MLPTKNVLKESRQAMNEQQISSKNLFPRNSHTQPCVTSQGLGMSVLKVKNSELIHYLNYTDNVIF